MAGETIITIIGNLTADPELRYTQSGTAVANFTVASTPRSFDRQSNDWKDGDALFLRCTAWRELGENVAGSLSKGARVIVTGALEQKSYTDKENNKRTSLELNVQEIGPSLRYATAQVTRAASKNGQQSGQQQQDEPWGNQNRPQQGQQPPQGGVGGGDVWNTPGSYDDDTPF